ncbi:hypothetical protein Q8344_004985 [Vibrio harveyi]|uniref:hypothetical protein n=1 Tax=Vibrio campbellii TaxID=680 RepID=UPI002893B7F1|nr:hypothetical protein [Vibrio harveyi]
MAKILLIVIENKKEPFPISIQTIDSKSIEEDVSSLSSGDMFVRIAAQRAKNLYECISSKVITNNFIEGHDYSVIAIKKGRLSGGVPLSEKLSEVKSTDA